MVVIFIQISLEIVGNVFIFWCQTLHLLTIFLTIQVFSGSNHKSIKYGIKVGRFLNKNVE